jgi:hypothetical protein
MPYSYEVHKPYRYVRTRIWGSLRGHELRRLAEQIASIPEFSPDMSILIDLRDLNSEAITANDLQELASTCKLGRGARRALVVSNRVDFGLARMFKSYRQLHQAAEQTDIFETLELAEAWLQEMNPQT